MSSVTVYGRHSPYFLVALFILLFCLIILPRTHPIKLPESLVKIALIGVTQHYGDLLDGKRGVLHQNYRTSHAFLKNELLESFACFLADKCGNVVRVIRKTLRQFTERDVVHMV